MVALAKSFVEFNFFVIKLQSVRKERKDRIGIKYIVVIVVVWGLRNGNAGNSPLVH